MRLLFLKCQTRVLRSDLFGEDGNVLVEGVGGADVASRHPGLSGRARRQLALLKHQRKQREKRVTAKRGKRA